MTRGTSNARALLAYLAVAVAASGWGTWPLILSHAKGVPAALQSAIVMTMVALAGGVFMVLGDRAKVKSAEHPDAPPRSAKHWALVTWLGVGDGLNILLFFAAYQTTTVAVAVLTHYLTPIFVAIAAPLVLREKATLTTAIAVAIAFAGLVLLLPWSAGTPTRIWIGAALGAGSAVLYAMNVLVNKGLAHVFSTSELTFYHSVVSVLILLLCVPKDAWSNVDLRGCGVVALGGIGPGAASGLLFVWGLRGIPASHASTLTLLEPLVAMLCGVVMGEALGLGSVVGGAMILGGASLVVLQHRPRSVP